MATYRAPQALVQVNNWPRYDITGGKPTSAFNADFNSAAGRSYVTSVVTFGAIFFILAFLFLLFFAIVNIAACCGCCVSKKTEKGPGGFWAMLSSRAFRYIAGTVVITCIALAAIAQVPMFRDGLTDSAKALADFASALTGTGSGIASNVVPPLNAAKSAADAFCNDAKARASGSPPVPQSLIDTICALPPPMQSAATASSAISASLNSTSSALTSQLLGSGNLNLNNLASQVYTGGVTLIAVFIGWLLSSTLSLARARACSTVFKVCNCVLIVVLAGVFVVTGVFVLVGAIGSDVCVAPLGALQSVVNATGVSGGGGGTSGADPFGTLTFYMTCTAGRNYTVAEAPGAYGQLLLGQAQLADARNRTQALSDPAIVSAYPWSASHVARINAELAVAAAGLAGVARAVDCERVSGIMVDILRALCDKGIAGAVSLFQLCAAVSSAMFMLALAAWHLCGAHPADALADATADAAPAAPKDGRAAKDGKKPLTSAPPAVGAAAANV